jgi:hypothetical protein
VRKHLLKPYFVPQFVPQFYGKNPGTKGRTSTKVQVQVGVYTLPPYDPDHTTVTSNLVQLSHVEIAVVKRFKYLVLPQTPELSRVRKEVKKHIQNRVKFNFFLYKSLPFPLFDSLPPHCATLHTPQYSVTR